MSTVTHPWVRKKVLIVVRTYPTPARRGVEVSCTAAITEEGEWIRLFPVPYRFLTSDRRFRKYQWVEVDMRKSSDPRPESYEINPDSINILKEPIPTTNQWGLRKEVLFPLKAHCLCCLDRTRKVEGSPTLGLFKPKQITGFYIEEDDPNWSPAEMERLSQYSMFEDAPSSPLEKIPFKFYYRFLCQDSSCNGHRLSCTDWELGQSYRQWRKRYGAGWENEFRKTYETSMILQRDTHFYVGTLRFHPNRWIIVGLFYPPLGGGNDRVEEMRLL